MIAILVLSAINVARNTSKVIAPLETLKQNYKSTGQIFMSFKEGIREDEMRLYQELINDELIEYNTELLDKQRTYQIVVLIISCIIVGFSIIGKCIQIVSESLAACCVVISFLPFAFGPLVVLILSALSLNKVKQISQFDLDQWEGKEGYNEIKDFNDYIKGFRGRDIAIIVLSSITVAIGVLLVVLMMCANN